MSEVGRFRVTASAAGEYDVVVIQPDLQVRLEPVAIVPPPPPPPPPAPLPPMPAAPPVVPGLLAGFDPATVPLLSAQGIVPRDAEGAHFDGAGRLTFALPQPVFPYLKGAFFVRFNPVGAGDSGTHVAVGGAAPTPLGYPAFMLALARVGAGSGSLHLGEHNGAAAILPIEALGTSLVALDQWHTLCVSWTPFVVHLYVDGVLEATVDKNVLQHITQDDYFAGTDPAGTLAVELGGTSWGRSTVPLLPFAGIISHALLAGESWNAAQVGLAHAWSGGSAAPPPPPPPPLPEPLAVTLPASQLFLQHDVVLPLPTITGGVQPYGLRWDYGDGAQGGSQQHRYEAGEFVATVTVTDAAGTVRTADMDVTVEHIHHPPPVVTGKFFIITHPNGNKDYVPNYNDEVTIRSARAGFWSAPSTWDLGRLPGASDVMAVDHVVTQDHAGALAAHVLIRLGGSLDASRAVPSKLTTQDIYLLDGGTLDYGTQANPVPGAEIVFADVPFDLARDPQQWGHGFVALGGTVRMHGQPKTGHVRLAREPRAGDTTLSFSEPVAGWKANDLVQLPDTRQLDMNSIGDNVYVWKGDEVALASVSADGKTAMLVMPLQFDHLGNFPTFAASRYWALELTNDAISQVVSVSCDNPAVLLGQPTFDGHAASVPVDVAGLKAGTGCKVQIVVKSSTGVTVTATLPLFKFLPHAANLTRSVTLRSENPSGARGHIASLGATDVDVRHACMRSTGRSTNEPPHNTRFDADGNVTQVGTNQIARYGLWHRHHHHGPFMLHGCVYHGDGKSKWPITIHGSHDGLVEANVVYHYLGSGVVEEDGTETNNTYRGNFICRSRGVHGWAFMIPGTDELLPLQGVGTQETPGAFWFIKPRQRLLDNVVCSTHNGLGVVYMGRIGDGQREPILECSGNEVYGGGAGINIWDIGSDGAVPWPIGQSVIKDFRWWNLWSVGIFTYGVNNFLFDGVVGRGDPSYGMQALNVAFIGSGYLMADVTLRGWDIQGMAGAINIGEMTAGTIALEDGHLDNIRYNIDLYNLRGTIAPNPLRATERHVVIRNVRFGSLSPNGINISSYFEGAGANLTAIDEILVIAFNGVPGDDFRLYYRKPVSDFSLGVEIITWPEPDPQAAEYVMPSSAFDENGNPVILGSPEPGLTNQQLWDKYKIATGGAIMPADAAVRPGLLGCKAGRA